MTRDPVAAFALLFLIAFVVAFWSGAIYFLWSSMGLWGRL